MSFVPNLVRHCFVCIQLCVTAVCSATYTLRFWSWCRYITPYDPEGYFSWLTSTHSTSRLFGGLSGGGESPLSPVTLRKYCLSGNTIEIMTHRVIFSIAQLNSYIDIHDPMWWHVTESLSRHLASESTTNANQTASELEEHAPCTSASMHFDVARYISWRRHWRKRTSKLACKCTAYASPIRKKKKASITQKKGSLFAYALGWCVRVYSILCTFSIHAIYAECTIYVCHANAFRETIEKVFRRIKWQWEIIKTPLRWNAYTIYVSVSFLLLYVCAAA